MAPVVKDLDTSRVMPVSKAACCCAKVHMLLALAPIVKQLDAIPGGAGEQGMPCAHSALEASNAVTPRMCKHPKALQSTISGPLTTLAQVLVQRFEGLLDRILRSKAYPAAGSTRGGAAAAAAGGGLGGGPGGGKGSGLEPELILPVRSLATSFWALGNMRYPLTSEQLDKIAGGRCKPGVGWGVQSGWLGFVHLALCGLKVMQAAEYDCRWAAGVGAGGSARMGLV